METPHGTARPASVGPVRGLVSRPSGDGVRAFKLPAPPDLAPVLEHFWTGKWDLRGKPPHHTELLSDPCVHFVVEQGGRHAGARVVGVWTRLWRRTLEGRGQVFGAKLKPGAARAFLHERAHRFTNRIVPLNTAFDDGARVLERDVQTVADDDQAVFTVFADWLRERRRFEEQHQVSLAVALVERITKDSEITSVERLAQVAGVGPRSLQRLFRDHVGASPKWTIRRNRLQEIAARLKQGEPSSLAALAANLGYADQAHLARDFKSAVGKSPRAFLAWLQQSP